MGNVAAYYILDAEGEPVGTDDVLEWAHWFEQHRECRIIKQDFIEGTVPRIGVSTVFLGLDYGWGEGQPVLWETLVFGTLLDGKMRRYRSKADALRGHVEMLSEVRDAWSAASLKE